jgi:hypothetical protein
MTPETIERNAHRIGEALNQRRKSSPVPKWLRKAMRQALQAKTSEDAQSLGHRLGALYGRIERRNNRDYLFCLALIENLSLLPSGENAIAEASHRALLSYHECQRHRQHSYLRELRRKFRDGQWSSFGTERAIVCRLLEGENVNEEERDMLADSSTPSDLRHAIARRVARLGQSEYFGGVVDYFVDMSRRRERNQVESEVFRESERVMTEMRDYFFEEWLPCVFYAYCTYYEDGPVRGRLLSVLASGGDVLVEPVMVLHETCSAQDRRRIWRLLHQLVRNGSVDAMRQLSAVCQTAPAQDVASVCEEVRQAATDYIARTSNEQISREILDLLEGLSRDLVESGHPAHRKLAEDLTRLLDWDEQHLHEMVTHLIQNTVTQEERNRLSRGARLTLDALADIVENPSHTLQERLRAVSFIPNVPACAYYAELAHRLWQLFFNEIEPDLRIALLPALAKIEKRPMRAERGKMELVYAEAGEALRAAITRHWTSLFPGAAPAQAGTDN